METKSCCEIQDRIIRDLGLADYESAEILGYSAFAEGYGTDRLAQWTGRMLKESDDYSVCARAAERFSAGSKLTHTAAVYAHVSVTDARQGFSGATTAHTIRVYRPA